MDDSDSFATPRAATETSPRANTSELGQRTGLFEMSLARLDLPSSLVRHFTLHVAFRASCFYDTLGKARNRTVGPYPYEQLLYTLGLVSRASVAVRYLLRYYSTVIRRVRLHDTNGHIPIAMSCLIHLGIVHPRSDHMIYGIVLLQFGDLYFYSMAICTAGVVGHTCCSCRQFRECHRHVSVSVPD